MTLGETLAFVRDTHLFECTLCFRVADLVGFDRDELHYEAFWNVRVDGVVFGSLPLGTALERGAEVERRVVQWYRRERIRRASR
jgi:hypothetical protein